MKAINISNEKARNAEVAFAPCRVSEKFTQARADGKEFANVQILKSTIDTEPHDLLAQFGSLEALGDELLKGDPEIDFEQVGMMLSEKKHVYLTPDDKVAYRIVRSVDVYGTDGELKSTRPYAPTEANVNAAIPVRWTGKLFPKDKAVRAFVFCRSYQLRHTNGLTYDFLYDMAKKLSDANAMMLMGAGEKGTQPLVLNGGGVPYRGFLEGRVDGDKYMLILHLTNLEIKTVL